MYPILSYILLSYFLRCKETEQYNQCNNAQITVCSTFVFCSQGIFSWLNPRKICRFRYGALGPPEAEEGNDFLSTLLCDYITTEVLLLKSWVIMFIE